MLDKNSTNKLDFLFYLPIGIGIFSWIAFGLVYGFAYVHSLITDYYIVSQMLNFFYDLMPVERGDAFQNILFVMVFESLLIMNVFASLIIVFEFITTSILELFRKFKVALQNKNKKYQ